MKLFAGNLVHICASMKEIIFLCLKIIIIIMCSIYIVPISEALSGLCLINVSLILNQKLMDLRIHTGV